MKILIPTKRPKNTFFDEITSKSENEFFYGNLDSKISDFDVVLFHWPEHIFQWACPNNEQLELLKKRLQLWESKVPIIYVLHNETRHFGTNSQFDELYKIVINFSNTIVHFGKFSHKKYSRLYPLKKHVVIEHPLYLNSFYLLNQNKAKEKLGIKGKKLIFVPGRVRNNLERNLILDSYRKVAAKGKFLIVSNMFIKKLPSTKGSYFIHKRLPFLESLILYIRNFEIGRSLKLYYSNQSIHNMSLLMSAADIIFIPRITSLNSGLVFLALTYKKIIVGPNIGNINEILEDFNFPIFDATDNNSVAKALSWAIDNCDTYRFSEYKLNKFKPDVVAKKWDDFLANSFK